MELSRKQKMLLHRSAQEAGYGDEERRAVQRNIGGFFSAADKTCTREGFIAVMAFYEARMPERKLRGFTPGYWAEQDRTANPLDALRARINQEAASMGWAADDVDRFLASKHMSSAMYGTVTDAPGYWLRRLLQGMIAIRTRAEKFGQRGRPVS